jgi:hypothetical protein
MARFGSGRKYRSSMIDPELSAHLGQLIFTVAGAIIVQVLGFASNFVQNHQIIKKTDKVEKNINGRLDLLLKTIGESERAIGKLEGIAQQKERESYEAKGRLQGMAEQKKEDDESMH